MKKVSKNSKNWLSYGWMGIFGHITSRKTLFPGNMPTLLNNYFIYLMWNHVTQRTWCWNRNFDIAFSSRENRVGILPPMAGNMPIPIFYPIDLKLFVSIAWLYSLSLSTIWGLNTSPFRKFGLSRDINYHMITCAKTTPTLSRERKNFKTWDFH